MIRFHLVLLRVIYYFFFLFALIGLTESLLAKESTTDFWDKHFQGNLAFTYTGISNPDYRGNLFFKLGYEDTWGPVKVVLQGRYLLSIVSLNYDVLHNDEVIFGHTFTREDSTRNANQFFRESYLQFELGDYTTLSIGKQIHTFGQFNIVSFIDLLLLPLDISDRSFKANKVENRLPQLSAKLSFFTLQNTEINLLYLPRIEQDSLFDFTLQALRKNPIKVGANFSYNALTQNVNSRKETVQKGEFPNIDNEASWALRILQYHSSITYGFTLFTGLWQTPIKTTRLLEDLDGDLLYHFEKKKNHFTHNCLCF